MWAVKYLMISTFVACVMSESISYKTCEINDCDISEVVVEPCTRDNENAACKLSRRKPTKMNFTFTPKFDADSLNASLVWVKDAESELPLLSLDKEACKYAKCPVKSGESQNYAIDVPIEKKFPLGSYNIKWTLKAPSGKQCCFMHDIKIVRNV